MDLVDPQPHLQGLESEHPMERCAAAAALKGCADPVAREALRRAAADPHWPVRAAALLALADHAALSSALQDPIVPVRAQAIAVLGECCDPESVPALAALLADPVAPLRSAAAQALGRIGSPSALPHLQARLGRPWLPRRERDLAVTASLQDAIARIKASE